jgi:cytidylate kinase
MHSEENNKRIGNPFVTISYEVGAYGVSVIESLCQYLQENENRKGNIWKVFDRNKDGNMADDLNLPKTALSNFSDSTAPEIEGKIELMVDSNILPFTMIYKIKQKILSEAELGYVIIIGRGGNIITSQLSKGVHIRIIGSFENRVRNLMKSFEIEEKKAREFIIDENLRRVNYFHKYFNKNINESLLYDLVINTDRLSAQDIVKEIGNLVLKRAKC